MNKKLPIYKELKNIVETVNNNKVTIIKAETGSGKSTQIPQALYEAGYKVVVTQPRRVAARSVAKRVADEMGVDLGSLVGYRTGFEKECSEDTRILFCTDGLELARQLVCSDNKDYVLCIDEVHEWNLNIEVLIAWAKLQLELNKLCKVVIMSATMDTSELQWYFDNCPVFEIEGGLYPVKMETIRPISSVIREKLDEWLNSGKNVLVFLPGKSEIYNFIQEYDSEDAIFLPLHGELSSEEQDLCFKSYGKPKVVVATNIAQTSITIPDIDVVLDFGKERRLEVVDGVEGLYLNDISRADCLQRKGRAGRVKNGEYYLCSYIDFEERERYSTPEISRIRIDNVVLKLLAIGVDIGQLTLFHPISYGKILNSKRLLKQLEAIKDNEQLTEIGYQMVKMPLDVRISRMLIEAEKRGVLKDAILIAALLQVGDVLKREFKGEYVKTRTSDIINNMKVFNMLEEAYFKNHSYEDEIFKKVIKKNYRRVVEIRKKLTDFYLNRGQITSTGEERDIIKCFLCAHSDYIYSYEYYMCVDIEHKRRQLDNRSVCNNLELLVGIPKDISIGRNSVIKIVTNCSKIDVEMIKECCREYVVEEKRVFDSIYDKVRQEVEVVYDNLTLYRKADFLSNVDISKELAIALANTTYGLADGLCYWDKLKEICKKNTFCSYQEAIEFYESNLKGVKNVRQVEERLENLHHEALKVS